MDFNKEKCLKLMRESEKLRQEGKSLWDCEKAESEKLNHYLTLLEDDIFWQSRNQYFQIIENFTNRSSDGKKFVNQFGDLQRENLNAVDMRKANLENEMNLQLNSTKSWEFPEIISALYEAIGLLVPDLDDSDSNIYAIHEEALRRYVKKTFLLEIR